MRLLSVEDNLWVQETIADALRGEFDVSTAANLRQARERLDAQAFEVILLDLQLPDGDGLDFCAELRRDRRFAAIPIVILSSRSELEDRVKGLDVGAVDYVAKPFSAPELLLRVQVSCMRAPLAPIKEGTGIAVIGQLKINLRLQQVRAESAGREVDLQLTPNEYKILTALLRADGHPVTRIELRNAVWGENVHLSDRTVDKNVCMLRKKLAPYCDAITTVPKEGYRFEDQSGRLVEGIKNPRRSVRAQDLQG